MFATHYHELTQLEGKLTGVNNYCIAVKESGDDIVFLRKIVRGGADRSYGIQVAKLAGVPAKVLDRAKILAKARKQELQRPFPCQKNLQFLKIVPLSLPLAKGINSSFGCFYSRYKP